MKIFKSIEVLDYALDHVVCNKCNCKIDTSNNADYISVEKRWNYFSQYDNEFHSFDLCESCYTELINSFSISLEHDFDE